MEMIIEYVIKLLMFFIFTVFSLFFIFLTEKDISKFRKSYFIFILNTLKYMGFVYILLLPFPILMLHPETDYSIMIGYNIVYYSFFVVLLCGVLLMMAFDKVVQTAGYESALEFWRAYRRK